jgi:hypothetical protein
MARRRFLAHGVSTLPQFPGDLELMIRGAKRKDLATWLASSFSVG